MWKLYVLMGIRWYNIAQYSLLCVYIQRIFIIHSVLHIYNTLGCWKCSPSSLFGYFGYFWVKPLVFNDFNSFSGLNFSRPKLLYLYNNNVWIMVIKIIKKNTNGFELFRRIVENCIVWSYIAFKGGITMKWPLTPPNNDKIYSIVSWKEIFDISNVCVKHSIQATNLHNNKKSTNWLPISRVHWIKKRNGNGTFWFLDWIIIKW